MNKSLPSSLTIEEAVAWMINLDFIPTGFTLLEMMTAFQEKAEVEFHNAKLDYLPKNELDTLKLRVDVCKAKYSLAKALLNHIEQDITNLDESVLVLSQDVSSRKRLTIDSVVRWAFEEYQIEIPNWFGIEFSTLSAVPEKPRVIPQVQNNEGLSPKKAEGLYTTFAFLLEAFLNSKAGAKLFGTPDKPNINRIAEHLENLAVIPGEAKNGQSVEAIKDRIEAAIRIKEGFLKNK